MKVDGVAVVPHLNYDDYLFVMGLKISNIEELFNASSNILLRGKDYCKIETTLLFWHSLILTGIDESLVKFQEEIISQIIDKEVPVFVIDTPPENTLNYLLDNGSKEFSSKLALNLLTTISNIFISKVNDNSANNEITIASKSVLPLAISMIIAKTYFFFRNTLPSANIIKKCFKILSDDRKHNGFTKETAAAIIPCIAYMCDDFYFKEIISSLSDEDLVYTASSHTKCIQISSKESCFNIFYNELKQRNLLNKISASHFSLRYAPVHIVNSFGMSFSAITSLIKDKDKNPTIGDLLLISRSFFTGDENVSKILDLESHVLLPVLVSTPYVDDDRFEAILNILIKALAGREGWTDSKGFTVFNFICAICGPKHINLETILKLPKEQVELSKKAPVPLISLMTNENYADYEKYLIENEIGESGSSSSGRMF